MTDSDRPSIDLTDSNAPNAELGHPAPRRLRVVLLDDDQEARRMARFVLEVDGRFSVVHDGPPGEETIDLVAEIQPAAVVVPSGPSSSATRWYMDAIHGAVPDTHIVLMSKARQRYKNAPRTTGLVLKGRRDWLAQLVELLWQIAPDVDADWPAWERRAADRRRQERRADQAGEVEVDLRQSERRSSGRRAS